MSDPRILLIGFGNPGRLDDGLGPAAAAAVEALGLPSVTVDSDYQLTVEDAEAAARHRVAILVDADETGCEPFSVRRLAPGRDLSFSTHSVSPEAVIGMAHGLFGGDVAGYVVGVRGYEFNEFDERLSERARANLDEALAWLRGVLTLDVDALINELDRRSAATAEGENPCKTVNT
ncbi:MAG: hydrogenase maturation protease [Planctomycetes bacterium]|nr:hydrogenase maturation protease [Planctomycetota bacterium]